jgi:hypothetical protein
MQVSSYMRVCDVLFEQQIPGLRRHLNDIGLRYDSFLLGWYACCALVVALFCIYDVVFIFKFCMCCGLMDRIVLRLMSVFAKSLPVDVAVRIWDLFVVGGDVVLLRAATGAYLFFLFSFNVSLFVRVSLVPLTDRHILSGRVAANVGAHSPGVGSRGMSANAATLA